MKKGLSLIASFLYASAVLFAQAQPAADERAYLDAMHRYITSAKLFGYVCQLSDTTLRGRLAGSEGMAKAVETVKDYYARWNLLPAGPNGGYIQEYPHPTVEIEAGSAMEILFPLQGGKGRETVWVPKSYPWADGWFAGNYSGNGDITAEVVYAGFGVSAPELGYDDYKGIDVKGKIVLIEGETPNRSRSADSIALWYRHTLHQTKLANAVEHGAAGLLYYWVPGPNALYHPGFVYCNITEPVVEDIFLGTGKTYKETVRSIYETLKPASFHTGKKARIKMVSTYKPHATGKNILGILKGSDPKLADEYVVISAHLDHLGMIPYHIAGANDNNASTAALLGVAEALSECAVKPKRSILFLSLDGEEAGLTGSTFYIDHPLVPKEKVKAILNLEQMGAGEALAASYATSSPQLEPFLLEANNRYVHRRLRTQSSPYLTRPRTDGAVFAKAGYPVADLRAAGGGYYHHPLDHPDSINPEILQSATQWLYWMTILIANSEN
ncbi:MAG: M28 family peptidase [Tannerellaceae bacterium]|nr:M28 family peptidase [Tannerellaceae bacterium]